MHSQDLQIFFISIPLKSNKFRDIFERAERKKNNNTIATAGKTDFINLLINLDYNTVTSFIEDFTSSKLGIRITERTP